MNTVQPSAPGHSLSEICRQSSVSQILCMDMKPLPTLPVPAVSDTVKAACFLPISPFSVLHRAAWGTCLTAGVLIISTA